MSWVKLDDTFHRNDKQLQMSDAAFRVYVCAMSWCAQVPEPTGHLTTAQARALVAGLGKRPGVIAELVRLNAWEAVADGYLIHDYEEFLERGSRDRVRAFRERKRAGNVTGSASETANGVTETPPQPPEDVTVTALARDGYPVPEPVPVGASHLKPPKPPSGGPADGLSTEPTDVRAYGERLLHHGRTPSAADIEFLRRVPYQFDRLAASAVLGAMDDVAARFVGQGKPMPQAKYLAGKLGDLQAQASDSGVRPRRTAPSSGFTQAGEALGRIL